MRARERLRLKEGEVKRIMSHLKELQEEAEEIRANENYLDDEQIQVKYI